MDEFLLSRIQFATNITFHILFPTITISLGWFLLFFKWRYSVTKEYRWMELYFFFTKIFALTFSLGVVSGVTMSFQFGTNWPGYMNTIGNIAGPLLAYEVLTAFFLEATFLGIMLYGFRRIPGWLHTLATFLVAAGTTLSAFWILTLNSWMQTPAGYTMIDGVAHAEDWFEIIFNPSMPYRLAHTLAGSLLTVAFLIAGLLAYRILKGDRKPAVLTGLKTAVIVAAIAGPIQATIGDLHGTNTRDYQPAKLAAMEALWESEDGAPMVLFALPDDEKRENRFEVAIPKLGSLIITRDLDGHVMGLEEFGDDIPRVSTVFWSFRIMLGIAGLMLLTASIGVFLLWRKLTWPKFFLRLLVAMTFSGWIGSVAGWYVSEVGRQPWLVTGLLKAKDAVAELPPENVAMTLVVYLITYVILLVAYIGALFYLSREESCKAAIEGGTAS